MKAFKYCGHAVWNATTWIQCLFCSSLGRVVVNKHKSMTASHDDRSHSPYELVECCLEACDRRSCTVGNALPQRSTLAISIIEHKSGNQGCTVQSCTVVKGAWLSRIHGCQGCSLSMLHSCHGYMVGHRPLTRNGTRRQLSYTCIL
jgi:hypothetical protein